MCWSEFSIVREWNFNHFTDRWALLILAKGKSWNHTSWDHFVGYLFSVLVWEWNFNHFTDRWALLILAKGKSWNHTSWDHFVGYLFQYSR